MKKQLQLIYKKEESIDDNYFIDAFLVVLDKLWGFIIKLVNNDCMEAEDILQEAVFKAYQSFNQLRDKGSFKSWIFQITYHEWVSRQRKNRLLFIDIPLDSLMLESLNPWDEELLDFRNGFGEEVNNAVNELEIEFKKVLWLRYVEDFDYAEIAKILSISEGTVSSRLFRAKALLKEHLWSYALRNGWRQK